MCMCIAKYKTNCKYVYPRRTPEKCNTENKNVSLENISKHLFLFLLHVSIFACLCIYEPFAWQELLEAKDSARFPGTGVSHDCELPRRCLEYNPGAL